MTELPRGGTTRSRRSARTSGDDRELAILATAERLLAGQPLSAVSVDDLARGVGISRPTFYFYFATRDDVLLTLLDRVVAEADAAMADVEKADVEKAEAGTTLRRAATGPYDVPLKLWRKAISAYARHFSPPSRAHPRLGGGPVLSAVYCPLGRA